MKVVADQGQYPTARESKEVLAPQGRWLMFSPPSQIPLEEGYSRPWGLCAVRVLWTPPGGT